MTVVSDFSPLIALARIKSLHLLPKLCGRIAISTEVYNEVAIAGAGLAEAGQIAKADWFEVTPVRNSAVFGRDGSPDGSLAPR